MHWVLIIVLAWALLAGAASLLIGRSIHLADQRAAHDGRHAADLHAVDLDETVGDGDERTGVGQVSDVPGGRSPRSAGPGRRGPTWRHPHPDPASRATSRSVPRH